MLRRIPIEVMQMLRCIPIFKVLQMLRSISIEVSESGFWKMSSLYGIGTLGIHVQIIKFQLGSGN